MVETPRNISIPPALQTHAKRWTERFKRCEAHGDWATAKAKQILRSALIDLAHGKCVYCESVLAKSDYPQIEHYIAKTVNPDLAFEWTNLFPSCAHCNVRKANVDHGNDLLKPDMEDPETYFWIHTDTGEIRARSSLTPAQRRRAERTIELCELQRPVLCEKRREMLSLIGMWLRSQDAIDETTFPLVPRTEHKLAVRQALRNQDKHHLAAHDKKLFETR